MKEGAKGRSKVSPVTRRSAGPGVTPFEAGRRKADSEKGTLIVYEAGRRRVESRDAHTKQDSQRLAAELQVRSGTARPTTTDAGDSILAAPGPGLVRSSRVLAGHGV